MSYMKTCVLRAVLLLWQNKVFTVKFNLEAW